MPTADEWTERLRSVLHVRLLPDQVDVSRERMEVHHEVDRHLA